MTTPVTPDALLTLAAAIIKKANKENPADAVLRQELRANRVLSRRDAGEISRMVFACYRWLGWLDQHRPVTAQLKRAIDLDTGFRERPETFSDDKLLSRCLPPWIASQVEPSPAWIRAIQGEPRLWIRARAGQGRTLGQKLGHSKVCGLPDAVLFFGEEDLFRTPEFQAGEFEIQDIASQAVGHLCAPKPGETWWDACAGEGGKTLHLSDLMANKGLIWASDRAEWRLKRLKLRAGRAGCFNYRSAFWDGSNRLPTKTRFDGILVDAPCAGVGTWQRNPHARWTTTPTDVAELSAVQKSLLTNVAGSLKPGGRLIYAVCTLTRSETVEVVDHINQTQPALRPLPLPNLFDPTQPPAPFHLLWPQDINGNGMFIAGWQRT